jgi:hypothetical protein
MLNIFADMEFLNEFVQAMGQLFAAVLLLNLLSILQLNIILQFLIIINPMR